MTPSHSPNRGGSDLRLATAVALAFLLAITAVAAMALDRERRLILAEARQDSAMLAALFEENTARTFEGVDSALVGVAAYVGTTKSPPHDSATRATMLERLKFLPTVRALFVIGPGGTIIHDTDYPRTPGVSLADRPYFRQYMERPDLVRDVSEALQSRSGTGWFVASTRRVTGSDGRFLGVAVAAVQLDSVARLYRKLGLQSGQQVSLLQANGVLLARYPQADADIGRSFAQFPVFSEKLLQQRAGTFDSKGPPWDYDRIVSYRAVENQPMVVVVTSRKETLLAPWKRAVTGSVMALVVLSLLTAAAVLFFGQRQRERALTLQLRHAEEAALQVAQANAKFRAFFDQGSLFAWVLGPEGDVIETNKASGAAVPPDCKFWDCAWWARPAAQRAMLQEGFERAAAGLTYRVEAAFETPAGETRLVEIALSPVRDPDGAVRAVAAVGVDITARKSQEEQLRQLAQDLSEVDRRRSEFLATLSHELRNVLTPVQNCAQIMKIVDPASTQAQRAREILSDQLVQMRRLVDDLLDVSRVNSGKVDLALKRIDLRTVLAQAAAAAHSSMERASHRFEMALPDEELAVHGDAARLQQVFANLLGNAAKYTPPGGHVELRARREGHEAIVEVVDDGIGIPVEAQARVFEMFEQVGVHAAHRQGGLGIGLALVQKLVGMHGGHVDTASDGTGRGSLFSVYLPLADAPPRVPGQVPAGGAARSA